MIILMVIILFIFAVALSLEVIISTRHGYYDYYIRDGKKIVLTKSDYVYNTKIYEEKTYGNKNII